MSGYKLTLRSEDTHRIVLQDGDTVRITLGDDGKDVYGLYIEGLVSDGKTLYLNGETELWVRTESAALDFPTNLKPAGSNVVTLKTTSITMEVVRRLSGKVAQSVSFTGDVTVARVFSGADWSIGVGSSPCVLSASVFTYVSDWSEQTISALADRTIDNMVYKEV